jgi:hypothetical protein
MARRGWAGLSSLGATGTGTVRLSGKGAAGPGVAWLSWIGADRQGSAVCRRVSNGEPGRNPRRHHPPTTQAQSEATNGSPTRKHRIRPAVVG